MPNHSFVTILMGSTSDLKIMETTIEILKNLSLPYEVKIASAHRTPQLTHEFVKDAESRGCQVFIAAAGLAAHLAGSVAAITLKPVIGVPIDAAPLNGLDSLLSTVQMPGGIPVACVAIGKAGAKNAAYLAAQILALSNPAIAEKLQDDRNKKVEEIKASNEEIKKNL